jgi:2'-5' RNA ligase
MRLFIAVNFPDHVKQKLLEMQNRLRESSLHGNFTLYENLHLTLVFIGEVRPEKISVLSGILDQIDTNPFSLCFSGAGRFKRDGGDIWWAGIEENRRLSDLQRFLADKVRTAGFSVENRRFSPHITLGREVRLRSDFDAERLSRATAGVNMEVNRISLMKSERLSGRLTYTEVYAKTL